MVLQRTLNFDFINLAIVISYYFLKSI
jgi:hypothetical protein